MFNSSTVPPGLLQIDLYNTVIHYYPRPTETLLKGLHNQIRFVAATCAFVSPLGFIHKQDLRIWEFNIALTDLLIYQCLCLLSVGTVTTIVGIVLLVMSQRRKYIIKILRKIYRYFSYVIFFNDQTLAAIDCPDHKKPLKDSKAFLQFMSNTL